MRSKFVRFQLRDLLFIALPALLIVIGVIWFALRFVNPAPPGTLVLSAATSGSPYYRYAERYQATFERNGVKLEIRKVGRIIGQSQGTFQFSLRCGCRLRSRRPSLEHERARIAIRRAHRL